MNDGEGFEIVSDPTFGHVPTCICDRCVWVRHAGIDPAGTAPDRGTTGERFGPSVADTPGAWITSGEYAPNRTHTRHRLIAAALVDLFVAGVVAVIVLIYWRTNR